MPEISPATPAVETPAVPVAAEGDSSLLDHAEQFAPGGAPIDAETPTVNKRRHRAPKDIAGPQDVPRIRELTGKVKDLEAQVATYRTQAEALEKRVATPTPPKPVTAFTEPRPVMADFDGKSDDPYQAATIAAAKWEIRKDEHDAAQQAQQTEAMTTAKAAAETQRTDYQTKAAAYIKAHPDRAAAFNTLPNFDNAVMVQSILRSDNAPDLVYTLTQQPDLMDELYLLTAGKPLDEQNVASTKRWLQRKVQAGTTGAATLSASPSSPVSRPPTPVRTTPMPPPADVPGDASSLSAHAKAFLPKPR